MLIYQCLSHIVGQSGIAEHAALIIDKAKVAIRRDSLHRVNERRPQLLDPIPHLV